MATGKRRWTPWLYVLPALILLALFLVLPTIQTFWLSLHSGTGFSPTKFVGLDNFEFLLRGFRKFPEVKWGDTLGMLALVLAAVVGATGWGMLITALARTPGQVASIGSAIMLIFGILGGSLISLEQMPAFVQAISKVTPNAWALDGFTTLGLGGRLTDLSAPILALLTMGMILFLVSVLVFGKKNLVQK